MIDFSFIGREGMIVDYEDIISMIGFNVVRYLKNKEFNEAICKMSIEDILLSYINRENEDISEWVKTFGVSSFNIDNYRESEIAYKPNMLYVYKLFVSAYKNGITNLFVHSNKKSNLIERIIGQTFDNIPVKYVYGDIVPILNDRVNFTYTTASSYNIQKCLDVKVPFALTIVDDYMYTADVLSNKIDEKLKKQNVYICYTSAISAGVI